MIHPIDPSAGHQWNPHRQPRQGDRPASGKRHDAGRFEQALRDELTLWQVLLEPEAPAIPEKTGFAAAFEAAERTATYRIAFYEQHQPEPAEEAPARGNWWDTLA